MKNLLLMSPFAIACGLFLLVLTKMLACGNMIGTILCTIGIVASAVLCVVFSHSNN